MEEERQAGERKEKNTNPKIIYFTQKYSTFLCKIYFIQKNNIFLYIYIYYFSV